MKQCERQEGSGRETGRDFAEMAREKDEVKKAEIQRQRRVRNGTDQGPGVGRRGCPQKWPERYLKS